MPSKSPSGPTTSPPRLTDQQLIRLATRLRREAIDATEEQRPDLFRRAKNLEALVRNRKPG